MFSKIDHTAPDPLYATAAACAADVRLDKVDLSVGVYRDVEGRSPVMNVVKAAERALVREQSSKAYRPLLGDPDFLQRMTEMVLGIDNPLVRQGRIVAIQATGGTGALRLAAALASAASPIARLLLGIPSWPSHAGIFASEAIEVVEHAYWRPGSDSPCLSEIAAAAAAARGGDLFLFHGPCHNPTGMDLDRAQRKQILALLDRVGAVPMLDVAYYGLGDGLDADFRIVEDALVASQRCMVALSCSKTFGLYRDRTGILFVLCADAAEAGRVAGRLGSLSRLLVSSAPAHGAEVVATILGHEESHLAWREELESMRQRIIALRQRLAECGVAALAGIDRQKGIFAMLPLTSGQVATLAREYAIYLPPSGRANLVGLRDKDVDRFVAAIDRIASGAAIPA